MLKTTPYSAIAPRVVYTPRSSATSSALPVTLKAELLASRCDYYYPARAGQKSSRVFSYHSKAVMLFAETARAPEDPVGFPASPGKAAARKPVISFALSPAALAAVTLVVAPIRNAPKERSRVLYGNAAGGVGACCFPRLGFPPLEPPFPRRPLSQGNPPGGKPIPFPLKLRRGFAGGTQHGSLLFFVAALQTERIPNFVEYDGPGTRSVFPDLFRLRPAGFGATRRRDKWKNLKNAVFVIFQAL